MYDILSRHRSVIRLPTPEACEMMPTSHNTEAEERSDH